MTRSRSTAKLLAVFVLILLLAPLASGASSVTGHWKGSIKLPGIELEVAVDLASGEAEGFTGTIDIPQQGASDLPLTAITVDGSSVTFAIEGIPGNPTFKGVLASDGQTLEGTFSQGGQSFPFALRSATDPATLARQALAGIDELLETTRTTWNVPGLAVAVVAGGEVVFAKGFGHRDVDGELPVTPRTLFAIGSTSKAFTTFLLGTLVDEDKLDWDEPVTKVLPGFRLHDETATRLMTPRDLVTHRSGLPRHDLLWYNNNEATRDDLVRRLRYLQPSSELREKFQYNNLMFLTAGHLAEKLTGKSWEELVRERIFTPLGMTRSTFSVLDSEQSDDYSLPYRETEEKTIERIPFRRIDLIGPAGSINSSLEDMCAWVACNLAGGKYRGKEIIKTATLKDIHTPHMTMGQPAQRRELSPPSYGLGWMIDTYRGHLRVHHGGGIDGFITEVSLFPQDDLGMVLFVNRTAGVPELLSRHLADRLFGLEPIDWLAEGRSGSEEIQKKVEEGKKEKAKRFRLPGTTPSHALADYAGTYEDPGYGRLTVTLEAGTLSGAINGIDFPLEHWHYEVFHGGKGGPTGQDSTFEDLLFLFEADTKGNVAAVSVQLEPSVDSIEFAKTSNPMLSDPAFLARLEGTYNLAGQTINVVLQGDHLVASVPMTAQPTYKLVPGLGTEFKLEGVPGVALTFDVPGTGPAIAIVLEQPGATLVAERSEEKVPAGS